MWILLLILIYYFAFRTKLQCYDFFKIEDKNLLQTGDLLFKQRFSIKVYMVVKTDRLWVFGMDEIAMIWPFEDFVTGNFTGRLPQELQLDVPLVTPTRYDKSSLYIRRSRNPLNTTTVLKFVDRNLGRPLFHEDIVSLLLKEEAGIKASPSDLWTHSSLHSPQHMIGTLKREKDISIVDDLMKLVYVPFPENLP